MSLMVILDMAASGFGDRTAVGSRHDGLTYAELQRRAGIGARALAQARPRHVVYVGESSGAFPVALLASAWADVPFVPLNYRLGDEQLGAALEGLEDPFVIADETSLPRVAKLGRAAVERDAWLDSTASGDPADPSSGDEESIAVLLYTSGTTSRPKAAILRHRHLLAYVLGSLELGAAAEDEASLVSVPPYHVAGVTNLLSNLYLGRRIVYLDRFEPGAWLRAAREEGITHAMLVPTMLARIVDELEAGAEAPALASIAYGGARMPAQVLRRALELLPETDFVNAYGLTETSSTIAVLGPEDHRAAIEAGDGAVRARLQSAGRAIPGVELQIRDEAGGVLPPGEPGQLWVRGAQISGEYVGRPAQAADGWFPTRDRAHIDEEGYLFVEGRADDTIIRGGENIAPEEIEDVLREHPAVAEAAVVGLADEEWGQRIAAAVVPCEGGAVTPEELRAWARERLRGSKTPDRIVLRTSLPHTETGKLLRRVVAAELEGEAG